MLTFAIKHIVKTLLGYLPGSTLFEPKALIMYLEAATSRSTISSTTSMVPCILRIIYTGA